MQASPCLSQVCEVSWSGPKQGFKAHVDRYKNSPVMHKPLGIGTFEVIVVVMLACLMFCSNAAWKTNRSHKVQIVMQNVGTERLLRKWLLVQERA